MGGLIGAGRYDFCVVHVALFNAEAGPPPVVDSDAGGTGAVFPKRFESVTRRNAQEVQRRRRVELCQLFAAAALPRKT